SIPPLTTMCSLPLAHRGPKFLRSASSPSKDTVIAGTVRSPRRLAMRMMFGLTRPCRAFPSDGLTHLRRIRVPGQGASLSVTFPLYQHLCRRVPAGSVVTLWYQHQTGNHVH